MILGLIFFDGLIVLPNPTSYVREALDPTERESSNLGLLKIGLISYFTLGLRSILIFDFCLNNATILPFF